MPASDAFGEARSTGRATTLLAAILSYGSHKAPCRIRNLSAGGALVDVSSPPPQGSTVFLSRGSLTTAAEVVRVSAGNCGLRFSEEVVVADWLPDAPRNTTNTAARSFATSSEIPAGGRLTDEMVLRRSSEEIDYVSRSIESIATLLLNDPVLKLRHATSMQQLAIAQQILLDISAIIKSEDKGLAVMSCTNSPLRSRLARKAR